MVTKRERKRQQRQRQKTDVERPRPSGPLSESRRGSVTEREEKLRDFVAITPPLDSMIKTVGDLRELPKDVAGSITVTVKGLDG